MSNHPMARILLLCSLSIAGVCAVLGAYALRVYSDPPVDPEWALEGSDGIPEGAVTVRFTGTATLLFSDGETHWMTDGWFSRPGLFAAR